MKATDSEAASTEQKEKITRLLNHPKASYREKQAVLATLLSLTATEADATYARWFAELSQRPEQQQSRYRRAA